MDLVYRGYKEPESKYVLWIKGDELYLYSRGVWKLVNNVVHINVDDELSTTSENPVQNKVVTAAIQENSINMKIIHTEFGEYEFIHSIEELIVYGESGMDPEDYERLSWLVNMIYQNTGAFHTSILEFCKEGYPSKLVTCFIDPEEYYMEISWNDRYNDDYITGIKLSYKFNDDYTEVLPVKSSRGNTTRFINETNNTINKVFNKWIDTNDLVTLEDVTRSYLREHMFENPVSEYDIQEILEGKYLGICLNKDWGNTRQYLKFAGSSRKSYDGQLIGNAAFELFDFSKETPEKYIYTFNYGLDGECSCGVKTVKFINDDNIIDNQ